MPPPPRSILSVPGSSDRFLSASLEQEADLLMIDFEDAVARTEKEAARTRVAAHLAALSPEQRARVLVRLNAVETPWHGPGADLVLAQGVVAVLPKATAPALASSPVRKAVGVLALIESPLGLEDAVALAREPVIAGPTFGPLDYRTEIAALGGTGLQDLSHPEGRLVHAAAGGVRAVARPTTSIVDEAVVHADAVRLSRLGYVGQLCIHPRQVGIVSRAYAPAGEDVRWARAVLAGAPGPSTSAVVVDGEMVDEPVLLRARSVLARAVPA